MRAARFALLAAAVLAALAVAIPASASAGHGAMIARDHARALPWAGVVTVPSPPGDKTCTAGTIQYFPVGGPPGIISSKWNSNGCHQFQSPELLDTGGATHYGNQWTTTVGVISTASSPNALAKAWVRYKNTAGGQHYCKRVYPTTGSGFFPCD